MIPVIEAFLAGKKLSANSRQAYTYDLKHFLDLTGGIINAQRLRIYQESLASLKPSARKRQISTVNQFLYFLYRQGQLDEFFKLENQEKLESQAQAIPSFNRESIYAYSDFSLGHIIASLILELGLSPSEILSLTWEAIDLDFQVVTLKRAGLVRVLQLTPYLLDVLSKMKSEGSYVFEHQGKTYSRQWLNKELAKFLDLVGQPGYSPQNLRQEFILQAVEAGISQTDLARQLGLKTSLTLEKYYK